MPRHSMEQALVLTSRQLGEDNRIVTMLSPERGVFDAMLYGGRKSRLRSMVSPWHSGTVWIYNDAAKHSIKITDFEPKSFRPTLRESLYKNMAASLATEIVIRTRAADENKTTWTLLCGFLDGMELSDETACRYGLLRFLWRYLGILGEQADTRRCARCGCTLSGINAESSTQNVFYSISENGFSCDECTGSAETGFTISTEALRYLYVSAEQTGSTARNMPLSTDSADQLRRLLFHLIGSAVGSKLKTLDAGIGIL